MKTKLLFESDSRLASCEAVVTACFPEGDRFGVALDRTVFFPEGGGQPCDLGFLNDLPVTDVRERDGVVLHYTASPLAPGTSVRATIDWPRRFDFMQQHTGEHTLSFCLWSLFGAENVGFHLGTDVVTIDIDRPLSEEQLMQAEQAANRQVFENRPVHAYRIAPEALETLSARKKSDKAAGNPRIVEIEGGDRCTCCAPHVNHTGEIGCIKIIRWAAHKKGLRIELACGGRAMADYRRKNRLILEAGALLSSKSDEVPEGIRRLEGELSALKLRLKSTTSALMTLRAGSLWAERLQSGNRSGVFFTDEMTPDEGRILMNALLTHANTAVFLLCLQGERVSYLLGRTDDSPADLRALCALAGRTLDGKGGGKPTFCQGSAAADRLTEEARDTLAQAFSAALA